MSLSIEQKLPAELLDRIVSCAPRESLRSLCLTSKTLSRLATSKLYSAIYLRETDHLPALTYLMLTSPAHAALVKSFIVPRTWAETDQKFCVWSWPRPDDPNLHGVLKKKCAEYTASDDDAEELYAKIESGENEDAVLALLLASLPNLGQLNHNFSVGLSHEDFVVLWPKIILGKEARRESIAKRTRSLTSNAQMHTLSELIDVLVTGTDDKESGYTAHLAVFFHMPNLRSIYGWMHGDYETHDPDTPFAKLKPQSCPVEYVELRCAKLDTQNFEYLLNAVIPGRLKTFNYELGGSWAWCTVEHPAMMQSLQPHHNTLEALGLSHDDYYPYEEGATGEKPFPCSFTSFTALKRLKIAPVYIWGNQGLTDQKSFETAAAIEMLWSALPENLEELWITRARHQKSPDWTATTAFVPRCLLPALDLVVQNKRTAFPNLQHLRVELPLLDWKDEWLDRLAGICKAAAAQGIQTTIILYDMFDKWGCMATERDWGWNEDVKWEPTRYSQNRECAKVWVEVTQQRLEHVSSILRDMKAAFEEERERYQDAKNEINKLGWLCTACQLSGEYDASKGIGLPGRFVDERLGELPYWKGRGGKPAVVT